MTVSSTEAELLAISILVNDHLLWIIELVREFGITKSLPDVIYEDNQGAISILNDHALFFVRFIKLLFANLFFRAIRFFRASEAVCTSMGAFDLRFICSCLFYSLQVLFRYI